MAKSYFEIDAAIGEVPDDDVVSRMIPKSYVMTKAIEAEYEAMDVGLREHLKKIDAEIYPGFHFSFDLWTDRGDKHHYLAVKAHEENKRSRSIDVHCIFSTDWEDFRDVDDC